MTQTKIDSVLAICTTAQPADLLLAGFEALTFVDIGNTVTLPDFGISENTVSQDYIAEGLSQQSKGFRSGQSSSIVVGDSAADAGQIALHTASATKSNYAFKLTSSDGTIRYSRAIIMRPTFGGGDGEAFDNYEFPIALNQEPIIDRP